MNTIDKSELNDFFVETFNSILAKEEKIFENTLYNDLTIKECHVIEAIEILKKENNNTMTHIANKINISVGALTTSIKAMIKKDYVKRVTSTTDHRVIYIEITEKGAKAIDIHRKFHDSIIDCILKSHSKEELINLKHCLTTFNNFFKKL